MSYFGGGRDVSTARAKCRPVIAEMRYRSIAMSDKKKIQRAGVRFDCETCGRLLREACGHYPAHTEACSSCSVGSLILVGNGTHTVQLAKWYRCSQCKALFMYRRRELVPAGDRAGFKEFT